MIDPQSGQIELEGNHIGPATTRAIFVSIFGTRATDFVVNEPWHSYRLPTTLAGMPFVVVVFFHGELLKRVDLAANPPTLAQSWTDWSMEQEGERKALHGRFLQQHLSQTDSTHTYAWGVISSVFDQISGGSVIIIKYSSEG